MFYNLTAWISNLKAVKKFRLPFTFWTKVPGIYPFYYLQRIYNTNSQILPKPFVRLLQNICKIIQFPPNHPVFQKKRFVSGFRVSCWRSLNGSCLNYSLSHSWPHAEVQINIDFMCEINQEQNKQTLVQIKQTATKFWLDLMAGNFSFLFSSH